MMYHVAGQKVYGIDKTLLVPLVQPSVDIVQGQVSGPVIALLGCLCFHIINMQSQLHEQAELCRQFLEHDKKSSQHAYMSHKLKPVVYDRGGKLQQRSDIASFCCLVLS
jgi:hypothetical protein